MSEADQTTGLEPSSEVLRNTNIARYISQRCEQDAVYKASGFARTLSQDQRPTYVDKMQQTARDIIDILKIDDALFQDEKYSEAFFTVCDSWLVNKDNKDNKDNKVNKDNTAYETEKIFLTQFTRILAGDKSQVNIAAAQNREEKSGHYVTVEKDTKEEVQDRKEFQSFKDHTNTERTSKLIELLNSWDEDSPLHIVREKLGITSPDQEIPYRAMVIEASKEKPWNSELQDNDLSEWEKLIGISTDAATSYDPEDGVPTIFLHNEALKGLLKEEEEYRTGSSRQLVGHEYAHTQRQMRIGAHTALGRFWDERMALYVSEGQGHADTSVIFQMMNAMLHTENDKNPLWDAFDEGIKSDQATAKFFRYISDKFGLRSTLLLFAVMPRSYIEPYGIDNIPEVRLDSITRADDLLNSIIMEREKLEPGSMDQLIKTLKTAPPYLAAALISSSKFQARMQLPDDIREVLEKRQDEQDTPSDIIS